MRRKRCTGWKCQTRGDFYGLPALRHLHSSLRNITQLTIPLPYEMSVLFSPVASIGICQLVLCTVQTREKYFISMRCMHLTAHVGLQPFQL